MIHSLKDTADASEAALHRRAGLWVALALLVFHAALALRTNSPPTKGHATVADIRLRLDPNHATAAELTLLPRIGPKLAENIVVYRAGSMLAPPFGSPEDLGRVPRIGPAAIEKLRPFLRFPHTATSAPAEESP